MNFVLVKFSGDYADEFDVDGFNVFTKERFEVFKTENKKYFENEDNYEDGEVHFYFGSNESLIFPDYDFFIRSFEVIEISDEQFETLKQLDLIDFGVFPDFRGY